MNHTSPCVSFIASVDFSEEARWLHLTESVGDLLGFEPDELVGHSSLELVHPDELLEVKQIHYDTIKNDKAAMLVYYRLRHKDPCKGYILCAISQTVVYNMVVGSVSLATPGPKAMHNASTASETRVVTPYAKEYGFKRWTNQPSILPGEHIIPSPPLFETHPLSTIHYASTSARSSPMRGPFGPNNPHLRLANSLDFAAIHPQTSRMAIIIDRFTVNGTITFVFNDMVLPITNIVGRHFFDFVSEEWEKDVRDCIEMVKGWGVNERGQPSDGGFGYGGFALCLQGRKSLEPRFEEPVSRHQVRSAAAPTTRDQFSRDRSFQFNGSTSSRGPVGLSPSSGQKIMVDAIFSAHSDGILVMLRPAC